MPHLQFFRGPEVLLEYRLRAGRTTIGRADTSDVALPGKEISRTHCIVEGGADGWNVVDRSKHGTTVDGVRVDGRAPLANGARVGIGPYIVEFRADQQVASPTAEAVPDRQHEALVAADEGLQVEKARVTVVSGPGKGRESTLDRAVVTVGAAPSDIAIDDPSLVPGHVRLRVSRGRVMIEPGAGATFFDGERVRDITPLHAGEELTIGKTVLRVDRWLEDEHPTANRFGDMVGASEPMRRVFGMLRRVAGHHAPVLIIGESGTGKELAARGVHDVSSRSAGPYVPINCGAIQPNLFESELFGHEKGAFTGAVSRKNGAFHQAEGGTLFLDEVGELPEDAQAKLLRALETGEVRRVGGLEVTYPDVRVIAATNRSLVTEVRAGRFREDLFFRLAVLTVELPSLRERIEDLPLLCEALCKTLAPEAHLSMDALSKLQRHRWPGNVRELRNVLTRATVLGGARIEPAAISFHDLGGPTLAEGDNPETSLAEAERVYIKGVLRKHGDNRSAAARELGIARSSLHYKMRKLGIS